MLFTSFDVAEVRHVVQRILVPCVYVIGLLGNSVSIYVLTRKRMRCTTNIYLTALAITDIIYLTMALLLSLKHYQYVQRHYELYWRNYGTVVWLCDACAYISIYIAVCFTVERFIAIRYPLKRQTFCSESLAKKVIAGVTIFCLSSTLSTAFEHQYSIDYKFIGPDGMPCNRSDIERAMPLTLTLSATTVGHMLDGSGTGPLIMDTSSQKPNDIDLNTASIPGAADEFQLLDNSVRLHDTPVDVLGSNAAGRNTDATIKIDYCQNTTFYQSVSSSLAKNDLYTRIWYFFTLFVFVLIPLCILSTFNIFLIMLVRRSKHLRGEMTNASSIRRIKRKSTITTVSQENRVTVTLIAVVLLFIVCQLPWAIYLIVSEHVDIEQNLQTVIGNIFNLLAAINAAVNFFLYCVLSDKYRKTVRELVVGHRYPRHRNATTCTSLYSTTMTTTVNNVRNGSRRYRAVDNNK